jgi:hypothetical protein
LEVLKKGDPRDLPLLCAKQGVVFGADMPPLSPATIRNQVEQKKGVYCGLFDTGCLRYEDAAQRAKAGAPPRTETLFSYRDRLARAAEIQLKIAVSGRLGNVRVILKEDVQPNEPMELQFIHEAGVWKLTAVPFY